jgi:o-succinylbenzoate---CoA ligase
MKAWQKELILNSRIFGYKELLEFSGENIVSSETQPWEKEIFRFLIEWLSDRDYIIQFSSGTTGKPKEIRLLKESMMISAKNTCDFLGFEEHDTALLCMPVEYIAGKMMIVRSMVRKLNLLLTRPAGTPDLEAFSSIDFSAMVPLQVMNLLHVKSDLSPVKKLIIGGAEINRDLEKMLLPCTTEVYATYGMAETCSHVALRLLNSLSRQKDYQAMPGITLSLDKRECLVIEADYLPQRVITNDLVSFTGPDTFVWIGRYDNLINSGGIKIVPEEVETLVQEKTGYNIQALGIPDNKLGQKLVFAFEKTDNPDSLPVIKAILADVLPRFWKPKEIVFVDQFPRNQSLKIDRRILVGMVSGQSE